jgi:hypothetical protein
LGKRPDVRIGFDCSLFDESFLEVALGSHERRKAIGPCLQDCDRKALAVGG